MTAVADASDAVVDASMKSTGDSDDDADAGAMNTDEGDERPDGFDACVVALDAELVAPFARAVAGAGDPDRSLERVVAVAAAHGAPLERSGGDKLPSRAAVRELIGSSGPDLGRTVWRSVA
ncbi:MAG: hypothetical protein ABIQ49_12600 [Gemmatimonadales bacterium]